MAVSVESVKKLIAACLLLLVICQVPAEYATAGNLTFSGLEAPGIHRRILPAIDCKGACEERCKLNSRHGLCTRACGTCCERCNCVPPGQSGNRELCGACYANMTTHHNRTKCP